jgi:hypothetical protein
MQKEMKMVYSTPVVEVLNARVEKGFAVSTPDVPERRGLETVTNEGGIETSLWN